MTISHRAPARRRGAARLALFALLVIGGLTGPGAAAPAAAACGATNNKSIGGTFTGEDGRRLSAMVGLVLYDANRNPINESGCPKQPGDDGPDGYTFYTLVNRNPATCCWFSLGPNGADPNDGNYENSWRIDGLPSNAAYAWVEAYPKSGQGITDYTRYGGSMRRMVPVNLSVDVRMPLGCGLGSGGDNGAIAGRVYLNGQAVQPTSVVAFSRGNEGTGQILGFVESREIGAGGSYRVGQLEPNQSYALAFNVNGQQYWFEHDYGNGVPVSGCATTARSFTLQPNLRALVIAVEPAGPGAVDTGSVGAGQRVFSRGIDGSLQMRSDTGSTPTNLGGGIVGDPDATSWGSGRIDVVATGTDGAVWHRAWNGSQWFGWESLGGRLLGSPSVVAWGSNRLDIFGVGTDRQLWHRAWTGSVWSPWEGLGGGLTSAPDAASWGTNRLDVFARGGDGALWHRAWGGSWQGWHSIGGALLGGPGAASASGDRIDIAVRGTNGAVYLQRWTGSTWTGYTPLQGGTAMADPDVTAAEGKLAVFVLAPDERLYRNTRATPNGGFGGWAMLP